MDNFCTCDLEIHFEFGVIDGRAMKVEVSYAENTQIIESPLQGGTVTHHLSITLPGRLELRFSGKKPDDTKVDSQGNAVQDIYVKINKIMMDEFPLSEVFLHQKIHLITENNQLVTSSYIGFNGTVTIEMEGPDVFTQYLRMNQ